MVQHASYDYTPGSAMQNLISLGIVANPSVRNLNQVNYLPQSGANSLTDYLNQLYTANKVAQMDIDNVQNTGQGIPQLYADKIATPGYKAYEELQGQLNPKIQEIFQQNPLVAKSLNLNATDPNFINELEGAPQPGSPKSGSTAFNPILAASLFAAPYLAGLTGIYGATNSLGLAPSTAAMAPGAVANLGATAGLNGLTSGASGATGIGSIGANAAGTYQAVGQLDPATYSKIVSSTGEIDPVAAAQLQAEVAAQGIDPAAQAAMDSLINEFSTAQAAGAGASTLTGLLSKITSTPLGLASLLSSGLSAGSSLIGNYLASKAQQTAAQNATNAQTGFFNIANNNLQPFIQTGIGAANKLAGLEGLNGGDSNSIMQTLQGLPGYQFALQQGLKSTQNAAAARGLGASGAALKGAANYATGLANNTYNNLLTGIQNTANTGANAAGNLASNALGVGSNIGSNITGAGNAQAGAITGSANSLGSAINSIPNYLLLSQFLQSQNQNNNNSNSNGFG